MDRVRPINIKGMRGAKGTQMLKVNEITKSVKPPFELAMYFRILGNLVLLGIESQIAVAVVCKGVAITRMRLHKTLRQAFKNDTVSSLPSCAL